MASLAFDYPDELSVALGKRPAEAVKEVKLMAALMMFKTGRVSSGLAAKLAGLSRVEFLLTCGQHGISVFQQTPEELENDLEAASHACDR